MALTALPTHKFGVRKKTLSKPRGRAWLGKGGGGFVAFGRYYFAGRHFYRIRADCYAGIRNRVMFSVTCLEFTWLYEMVSTLSVRSMILTLAGDPLENSISVSLAANFHVPDAEAEPSVRVKLPASKLSV